MTVNAHTSARHALAVLALVGLAAAPLAAQGRGRNNAQSIPPGQMPRAGECRVWYEGVPPGRQPRPTSCDEAERIASRSSSARVIYGDESGTWNGAATGTGVWGRDSRPSNGRPTDGRAIPRGEYPGTYGYPESRYPAQRGVYASVPYRNGFGDGVAKAQEDTRDGDKYDPARHGWYKSANRGYDGRYGSRDQYAQDYRDGFLEGYRETYRGSGRESSRWWPF